VSVVSEKVKGYLCLTLKLSGLHDARLDYAVQDSIKPHKGVVVVAPQVELSGLPVHILVVSNLREGSWQRLDLIRTNGSDGHTVTFIEGQMCPKWMYVNTDALNISLSCAVEIFAEDEPCFCSYVARKIAS
jgi:hypothetical protein